MRDKERMERVRGETDLELENRVEIEGGYQILRGDQREWDRGER